MNYLGSAFQMAEIHDAMELLRIEVERGKKTQETKIERGGEEKEREADQEDRDRLRQERRVEEERRGETTVQPRQPLRQPPRQSPRRPNK